MSFFIKRKEDPKKQKVYAHMENIIHELFSLMDKYDLDKLRVELKNNLKDPDCTYVESLNYDSWNLEIDNKSIILCSSNYYSLTDRKGRFNRKVLSNEDKNIEFLLNFIGSYYEHNRDIILKKLNAKKKANETLGVSLDEYLQKSRIYSNSAIGITVPPHFDEQEIQVTKNEGKTITTIPIASNSVKIISDADTFVTEKEPRVKRKIIKRQ